MVFDIDSNKGGAWASKYYLYVEEKFLNVNEQRKGWSGKEVDSDEGAAKSTVFRISGAANV